METKLISVIISLYNKEQWIASTIQSVLDQTYQNFELIIVNDGSTDRSLEIASSFKDSRIKIFSIDNAGQSHARNYGIGKSKGDFIAFLDADDTWFKTHLEQLINVFNNNSLVDIACDKYTSEEKNNEESKIVKKIDNLLEYFSKNLFFFSLTNTLIKFDYIKKHNLYLEESLSIGEDINFLLKLNQYASFYLLDAYGLFYNRDDRNSMMNNIGATYRKFPHYFKGVNLILDHNQKVYKKRFLKNEYYKIAFQNRPIRFTKEEWQENIVKSDMPIITKIIYLFIRFTPDFFINSLKKYKPY